MPSPFEAIAGVPNACQVLPNIVTGGQPSAEHLRALHAAGVSLVLDIRDPMEPRPMDEPALARELGIRYENVAVVSGVLSDGTLERILEVLRAAGTEPLFFHCASGNRVGGALIPFLMIDHQMDQEDAIAQAMRVGLRSAELMEWGLDYARRHA